MTNQLTTKVLTHLELTSPTRPEWSDFQVHAISGKEAFSRLGKLSLRVSSTNQSESVTAHPLLKQLFMLKWHDEHGSTVRTFKGLCTQVRQCANHEKERIVYNLVLRPSLVTLKWRKGSRCFRNKSALEVVTTLLDEHEVVHELQVTRSLQNRALTVQYRETDYALMKRLLAEEGLFFFVKHPAADAVDQPATVVIADAAWVHAPVPNLPPLQLRSWTPRGGKNHLLQFNVESSGYQPSVRLHKYDFRNPQRKHDVTASDTPIHTTTLHHDHFEDQDHADDNPAVAREQLQRDALVASGTTPSLCLMVGFRFAVHADVSNIADWIVVELHHGIDIPCSDGGAAQQVETAAVRLRCVPATTAYRPPLPKRQAVTAAETAVVVGPETARVHTDRYGRVKVRFHWDTTTSPEDSSCWVRVTQGWAGQGWGSQYIPRVGMEVAIGFMGGDPDRPMVTGCLYNGTHPPPFALPDGATRSGVRTHSVPGGGGHNELSFEDQEGSEEVLLRAQREFRQQVGEDAFVDIARHSQIAIGGSANTTIGEALALHVGGSHHVSTAGNHSSHTAGATSLHTSVLQEHVAGTTIRTSETLSQRVAGDASLIVGGHYNLTVGAEEGGGVFDLAVRGPSTILADEGFAIHSDEQIELVCGTTRLALTPEGLFIDGNKVRIDAEETLSLSTETTELRLVPDRLEALAAEVVVDSQGASILLDNDAHIDGTKVLLNCGGESVDGSSLEDPSKDRQPIDIKLLDGQQTAYANCRYELVCAGQRFRGTTTAGGRVQHQVPASAKQGSLTLWPKGVGKKRLTWQLKLDSIEPASTIKGAQARLQNLGYYQGSLDGQSSPLLESAIVHFQENHGLHASGEMDAQTTAALSQAHS